MRSILVAALFGLASVAGATEAVAPVAPPATTGEVIKVVAEPEWKSEKLICHRQEVIGSLIQSKRVCATARNWQRMEQNAKDTLGILIAPGAYSPNH
jgi:hypothetical protein